MTVTVYSINIPDMSTIGYGSGVNDEGKRVRFVGDHRPMRHIGEAMQNTTSKDPIVVDLEDWQIQSVEA
jgi:hypothetical protein